MNAKLTRIITGLAIIAVGVGFLLDNLNVIEFGHIVRDWWPLAVIAAGVLVFMNDTKNYLWALLIIGIGVVFQIRELGLADINPWQLVFPVVIIAIGYSIAAGQSVRNKVSKSERDDLTAILGGTDQKNTSEDFKGSKVTAVLGGVKLDLRKATIKHDAYIEVFSFWGGVELIVPRNVVVRNQTSAILGGVENKTDQDVTKGAPVLYVTGDVIMAGVEIKN